MPLPPPTPRALAVLLLAAALAACGGSDDGGTTVEPPPNPGTGLTQPAAIAVLGQGVVTDRVSAEVSARGRWVYSSSWGQRFATGNVVYVWDGAGNVPVLTDSLIVDGVRTTGDVQVSDDGSLLVVATEPEGSLVLYSLADPAHPRFVSRYRNFPNGVHTAQVSRVNGRLYAFAAVNPTAAAGARLTIVDLSNPAAPQEVTSISMGQPFVHDTFVRDGVLFTANWDEGLVVWDLGGLGRGGSVSAPLRVGRIVTRPSAAGQGASVHNAWWLHVDGRKRYVAVGEELTTGVTIGNSSAGDLHIVDLNDLANPTSWREVAVYHHPTAGVHNVVADEARGVLYAAYYDGGVRAFDVRGDLSSCTDAQRTADGRCDLAKMGREIGVALAGTPRTRDPRTGQTTPPFVWGVDLTSDALWATDMLGGVFKLRPITR
ncbi:hypothetical protein [Roseisolibacter sp. H3M3-2]|uniref:LVIVD repeat-containing protein n=1 Tax=Roseisolibacter sp. H3M3-2 TaxID=3031323 RepID=UPI0023D9CF04|nr:hypothetical protein [Roseisolibacter sp. H3M3-2]MDF1503161.1 hypothetical protein [Roseisolibacter sp. H3M3-2]